MYDFFKTSSLLKASSKNTFKDILYFYIRHFLFDDT